MQSSTDGKQKVERADQLPVHTYAVPNSAIAVLNNHELLQKLSTDLASDLVSDLAAYDIRDKATLRSYYATLSHIALMRREYSEALEYTAKIRDLQEKPAAVEMSGIVSESIIAALKDVSNPEKAFESYFKARLSRMNYDVVQNEVKAFKGQAEMSSANVVVGLASEQLEPIAKSGQISKEIAMALLELNFVLRDELPYKQAIIACLKEFIDAHATMKEDIWGSRNVDLTGESGLIPVRVAVWDTGVDVSMFGDRVWTDPSGGPDRYGIAWDLDCKRTTGPLRLLHLTPEQEAIGKRYSRGLFDMQCQVDSREASEVKEKMSTLAPEELKGFIEPILAYTGNGHGTHVAGVSLAGNPAARLVTIRFEIPYTMAPYPVSREWGRSAASYLAESVGYLRSHGVRVVNMSWGYSPLEFEQSLEYHHVGSGAAERRRIAVEIFEEMSSSFEKAIKETPDTLFVAACGNENSDSRFEAFIPASFDLSNVITVGAVDSAGDEASFTNYGSSALYANGFHVDSVVPGGGREAWSGTSMAAPQVTNLAGKLLAKYPTLSTAQLRNLILDGTDEKAVGKDRTIRLLNEKSSFALAAAKSTVLGH